jgi:hypothetical protein
VLSVMRVAFVDDLTPVNRILEQVEQAAPPERDATAMGTLTRRCTLVATPSARSCSSKAGTDRISR